MSFDLAKPPKLLDEDKPTSASPAHTLYLEIDLEVPPGLTHQTFSELPEPRSTSSK